MALITFARVAAPAASFSPTVNPDYSGYIYVTRWHQPKDLSDTGAPYIYNKGNSEARPLKWPALSTADLALLIIFYDALAGGGYTFTFTEHDGTVQTARIKIKSLKYKYAGGGKNEVEIELEIL
jgi:hypothetical protein